MKTLLLISSVLLVIGATAKPVDEQRTLKTKAARQKHVHSTPTDRPKPDQLVGRRFTFSGIAVQVIKAENPLQLLNPIAPEEYGSDEDKVNRDLHSGKVDGLKILSFKF